MSESSALPPLMPAGRRYVQYFLMSITAALALAPFLGTIHVPGFSPILALFPINHRGSVIPFATFLLFLPVVAMQFFAKTRVAERTMNRWFLTALGVTLVGAIALYVGWTVRVADVWYRGGDRVVRYVVGAEQRPDCPCRKQGLEIEACVGNAISFEPRVVESCYHSRDVQQSKILLAMLYFTTMLSFGSAIALLVVRERRKPRRR